MPWRECKSRILFFFSFPLLLKKSWSAYETFSDHLPLSSPNASLTLSQSCRFFKDLMAGGTAGAVSKTLVAPIEVSTKSRSALKIQFSNMLTRVNQSPPLLSPFLPLYMIACQARSPGSGRKQGADPCRKAIQGHGELSKM